MMVRMASSYHVIIPSADRMRGSFARTFGRSIARQASGFERPCGPGAREQVRRVRRADMERRACELHERYVLRAVESDREVEPVARREEPPRLVQPLLPFAGTRQAGHGLHGE